MPGCLLSGSISSQLQRGSMRAELRCLAAGQPSRPISVGAPLWSQVVGRAYREDQQRSVSPLNSLSLHLVSLFLSFLFYCPLSFWHYLPPMFSSQITIFPSTSFIVISSVSHLPLMLCLVHDLSKIIFLHP